MEEKIDIDLFEFFVRRNYGVMEQTRMQGALGGSITPGHIYCFIQILMLFLRKLIRVLLRKRLLFDPVAVYPV